MTALRTWLIGGIATALLVSMAQSFISRGAAGKLLRLLSGCILLLVLLRPLIGADWEKNIAALQSFRTSAEEIQETYEEQTIRQQETVIQQQTEAYIEDIAETMGISCCPEVQCELRDGVPFPAEVSLHTPYRRELSEKIAADIGIADSHQYWQEGR